jgi:hypothetical protein
MALKARSKRDECKHYTCVTCGFSFCGLLRALTASSALSLSLSLLTRLLSLPREPPDEGLQNVKVYQGTESNFCRIKPMHRLS